MNASEQQTILWLKYWIQWLYQYEQSSLSDSARVLLEDLERKHQRGEISEALDLIDRLKGWGEKSNPHEFAEIRLWSSLALAQMNLFKNALDALKDAVRLYKRPHALSVALWMMGCIQWVVPLQEMKAIGTWQRSIQLFEELRYARRGDISKYNWYEERCNEMQQALHIATEQYAIPPFLLDPQEIEIPSVPETPMADTEQPQSSEQQESENEAPQDIATEGATEPQDVDWLGLFTVYENIKAGDFGPSSILIDSVGEVEVNQVIINGFRYRIQSLDGTRFIRTVQAGNFIAVKVSGDSMNNAGILDGDYVLLRLLPKDVSDLWEMNPEDTGYYGEANHSQVVKDGDIVAAEILSEDAEIVLKRIFRRGKKVVLSPDSTNPKYQEREFDGMNQGFLVSGVVVAVFKQL